MRRTLALVILVASRVAAAAPTPVAVTGDPVAPVPAVAGTGLCSAAAVSSNPATDFPQSAGTFVAGMNSFIDAAGTRVQAPVSTSLDLSNNDSATTQASFGDFTGAVASCPSAGCPFAYTDTTTSFATRLRGFIAVTPAMVGPAIHFGFFADDAVAFSIYDAAGTAYPVVVRPAQLGAPSWRTTNTVTFAHPGLYPVEILHAQVVEHAALEMSLLAGGFADFELPVGQAGSVNLFTAGFTLAAPATLYRAQSAGPPATCAQCPRSSAGAPGTAGCTTGEHCNTAAVCEACASASACGPTCAPCAAATPICAPTGSASTFVCMAAPAPDAGPTGSPGGGGCGCTIATRPGSTGVGALAGVLLAGWAVARRKRARRSTSPVADRARRPWAAAWSPAPGRWRWTVRGWS